LSRGKVLTCTFELRDAVHQEHEYAQLVADDEWIAKLAYLSDIFIHLNELNRKMQGKNKNILTSMDKIQGFHGKLKLWLQHIANGSTEMFPTVCSLAAGNKLIFVTEGHLNALQQKFFDYSEKKEFNWLCDPFSVLAKFLSVKAQEELMDLKADRTLKLKFCELSFDTFWLSV
jgi:hypothetical protein